MPVTYVTPLDTALYPSNINAQIAKGPDLSWIGNLPADYFKGQEAGYQERQRNLFAQGLPTMPDPNDPKKQITDWATALKQAAQAGGGPTAVEIAKIAMSPLYNPNVQNLPFIFGGDGSKTNIAQPAIPPSTQPASTQPLSPSASTAVTPSTDSEVPPSIRAAANPNGIPQPVQQPTRAPLATPSAVAAPAPQPATFASRFGAAAQPTSPATAPASPPAQPAAPAQQMATPRQIAQNTGGDPTVIARALGVAPDQPVNMGDLRVRQAVIGALRGGAAPASGATPLQPGPGLDVGGGQPVPFQPRDPTYGGLTLPGMDAAKSLATLNAAGAYMDSIQRGGGQSYRDRAKALTDAIEKETEYYRKGQETLYTKGNEALGEQITSAVKSGELAYPKIQNLNLMQDALERGGGNVSGGPFGDLILKSKQAMQQLFGIDTAGLNETQVVSKVGFGLATQVVRALTARPTQMEVGMALNNNPGLLLTDSGSLIMLDVLRQQAAQEADLSRLASNQANWSNWPQVRDAYYKTHPIMSPFDRTKPLGVDDFKRAATQQRSPAWSTPTAQAAGAGAAPAQIPPPDQRQRGQTYQTPTGPRPWLGTGWGPVQQPM